jgi:hypothetical protein
LDEDKNVPLSIIRSRRRKEERTPKEEIVPKEFWKYLETVFSEREVGKLPSRSNYNHKIEMKPGYEPQRGALYRQGPTTRSSITRILR